MAARTNLVNLDAMIKREDFASVQEIVSYENVSSISIRDFELGGLGMSLRKPDFQRETNHWSPEQVVSLLECFVNGDLIPSVILWKSDAYVFVIDGGHRLSVLKAWYKDDYGDGADSYAFFGETISEEQRKMAKRTREMVNERVRSWKHYQTDTDISSLDPVQRFRITAVKTRAIPIQWVSGNADKAETSFFKINTKGTALDGVEELLLLNRRKPIAISARAIIRAGSGHRYWSSFEKDKTEKIESYAKEIHELLFDPELKQPIKSLDLPLGGPKNIRGAIQELIDFILVALRDQSGNPKGISDTTDDIDGVETIETLCRTLKLTKRITGNKEGSLGLHPAIYFYGPTGRHIVAMFMGTAMLVASKLINNDQTFFQKFTHIRSTLEKNLIKNKDLISSIISKIGSKQRAAKYADFLGRLIQALHDSEEITGTTLVRLAGLEGKIVVGDFTSANAKFSEANKSQIFIEKALEFSLCCPICKGYLIVERSVSYDHIKRVREGGQGTIENGQLTHPYCNQSYKN